MAKDTLLEPAQLDSSLAVLNADALEPWTLDDGKLHRRYKFSSFSTAFAFMTQAAMVCEVMDHHPKWTNVWNMVEVGLLTHRSKGITLLDIEMAAAMEQIAKQYLS
ncbi:MAG: 4a-hydroxytetrahydrobiopterin dehydratase [Porticoccaceae bacterium]|nr:4a-hydroxytetrahydrobiopterin dehydratase [Porticoccaceae bacterium]